MDNNLISVDYGADLASSILGFVFFFFTGKIQISILLYKLLSNSLTCTHI